MAQPGQEVSRRPVRGMDEHQRGDVGGNVIRADGPVGVQAAEGERAAGAAVGRRQPQVHDRSDGEWFRRLDEQAAHTAVDDRQRGRTSRRGRGEAGRGGERHGRLGACRSVTDVEPVR